jgi:hypothetical protein
VGKKEVKFQYLRQFFIETPPAVTDAGKPVRLGSFRISGEFHKPVEVNLVQARPSSEEAPHREARTRNPVRSVRRNRRQERQRVLIPSFLFRQEDGNCQVEIGGDPIWQSSKAGRRVGKNAPARQNERSARLPPRIKE